ncbi:hypothetical protein EON66_02905, partial [archaeon]
ASPFAPPRPPTTTAVMQLDVQSTYCHALQEHCNTTGRAMRVINLDPAAETFKYTPSFGSCAAAPALCAHAWQVKR